MKDKEAVTVFSDDQKSYNGRIDCVLPHNTVISAKIVIESFVGFDGDWAVYHGKDYFSKAALQVREYCPDGLDLIRAEQGTLYSEHQETLFKEKKLALLHSRNGKNYIEENHTLYSLFFPENADTGIISEETVIESTRTHVLSEEEVEAVQQKYLQPEQKGSTEKVKISKLWWIVVGILAIALAGILYVLLM